MRRWMSEFEKIDLLKDIYYSKDYTDLYLSEGEEIFEFDYCDGKNKFYNLSVKRIIDKIGNSPINDGYYDLETAYGYGGFYSTTQDDEFLRAAMGAYHERCSDEKIIAEFLRFHPYNSFPFAAPNCLDFLVCDRQTVAIDLSTPKDLRWLGYSSTTRNILRKSSTVMQFNQTDDIDEFMKEYNIEADKLIEEIQNNELTYKEVKERYNQIIKLIPIDVDIDYFKLNDLIKEKFQNDKDYSKIVYKINIENIKDEDVPNYLENVKNKMLNKNYNKK